MTARPRRGFVGIDVDSLGHYYPDGGGAAPEGCNPVWERAVPRFLELLDEAKVRATFFVVAQDLQDPSVRRRIGEMARTGHEIASHSLSHPQSLACLSLGAKRGEIQRSQDLLSDAIAGPVVGFRAPAWTIDEEALGILEERGFHYDSSIMPCSLLVPMKLAYWIKSRGRVSPRALLGRWHHAFAPLEPYFPSAALISRPGRSTVLELPIAVLPVLRLPFWHTIHMWAGWGFFRTGYRLIRGRLSSLHYQCHAIDLIDFDKDGVPAGYREMFGLKASLAMRRSFLRRALDCMARDYRMMTARELSKLTRPQPAGRNRSDTASLSVGRTGSRVLNKSV